MRKITIVSLVSALLALAGQRALADEIVIKLATSAPAGSPWHLQLKEVANQWSTASGGHVQLKIFPGGTLGNEGDMVRKMRIGQIQAAALSTVGLHDIAPEPQALDLPLLVKNNEERDYLLTKMAPKLEEAMAKKGYVVLAWSDIGFTHFFSTQPRPTLAAMREGHLFVWDGDPASREAWSAGKFDKLKVLSATDIVPSLQTGIIDTVVYTKTLAFSLHMFQKAKYMMDLPYSTLTGATVIDKKVWDRIPAELQPKLKQIFNELGKQSTDTARKLENDALAEMKKHGLQIVHVTDEPEWYKLLDSIRNVIRGKVVPESTFDEVFRIVKEYRASHAAH